MTRVRPSLILALLVVVLTAALGGLTLWRGDTVAAGAAVEVDAGGAVPVSSTTLTCPDVSALGTGSSTDVTLVAPELVESDAGAGGAGAGGAAGSGGADAVGRRLGVDAAPLVELAEQGPSVTETVEAQDAGPVVVRTVGELAPGLSATQITTVPDGDATGVAAAACAESAAESWFVGIGTEIGHRPVLSLTNVEPAVASVDITLYGPDGPLDVPSLRDVAVAPGDRVTYELDGLAPDLEALAVAVQARTGRVAAAVRDTRVDALTSLGVDWTPPTTPGTRVIVPGLSGGDGVRLLQLVAPGELDTRVQVRVLTATGAIVPVGLEDVELIAGAVQSVDLEDVLDGAVAAIELTSEVPVVAGVRIVAGGADGQDMAYTAGATALTGPAIVPGVRAGDGWVGRLVLSADDGGADGLAPQPTPTVTTEPLTPTPSPTTSAPTSADRPTSVATPGSAAAPGSAATPAGAGSPAPTSTPAPTPAAGAEPVAGRVLVSYLDASTGASLAAVETEIPAGSTVVLVLTVPDDAAATRFSVVVTPLAGVVYGTYQSTLTTGAAAGFSILPLFSPRLEVEVPAVRYDLSTGLRTAD